jgi:hypothetical protein
MTTLGSERTAHHCDFSSLARSVVGPLHPGGTCASNDGAIGWPGYCRWFMDERTELAHLRGAMPARHAAQLLVGTPESWRHPPSAAIIALSPPCLSTVDHTRLQQLAYSPPVTTRPVSQHWHQGSRNPTPNRINLRLATVTDPSTGRPVVFFFWKAYLPIENTLNGRRPRLVLDPEPALSQ